MKYLPLLLLTACVEPSDEHITKCKLLLRMAQTASDSIVMLSMAPATNSHTCGWILRPTEYEKTYRGTLP